MEESIRMIQTPSSSGNGHANAGFGQRIDQIVKGHKVVLFMKGTAQFPMCGFSGRAIQVLKACGVNEQQRLAGAPIREPEPRAVGPVDDGHSRRGLAGLHGSWLAGAADEGRDHHWHGIRVR